MRAIVIIHEGNQLNAENTEAISTFIAKLGKPGQTINVYELDNSELVAARLTMRCLDHEIKENSKDRSVAVNHACTYLKGLTDVPKEGCSIPKILDFSEVCKNHCETDEKFRAAIEIIAKNNDKAQRHISHVAINAINHVYSKYLA